MKMGNIIKSNDSFRISRVDLNNDGYFDIIGNSVSEREYLNTEILSFHLISFL